MLSVPFNTQPGRLVFTYLLYPADIQAREPKTNRAAIRNAIETTNIFFRLITRDINKFHAKYDL